MTRPAKGLKQVSRTPRSVRGDAALLTDDEDDNVSERLPRARFWCDPPIRVKLKVLLRLAAQLCAVEITKTKTIS